MRSAAIGTGFGLILAAAAGAAQAQSAARPTLDLSALRPDPSYARIAALREAGVAQTSVERRVAGKATVGVGFLCGLQPRRDESSGSAFGIDPHGRFLGAKLSRAF